MRCPEANSQLQLYIDNRLSMYQVRELERHLAQCAACQQQLYLLEEVTSALRELPPVVEPIDMTMLINRRLDHTGSRWNRNTLQVVKGDDGSLACSLTYGNCEKAPCKRYTPGVFSAQPPRTCLHSYYRRHRLYLVGRVAPPAMGYNSAGD